jgi:hypothetical protein
MAHLAARSSMGRDPRTRTPVMSDSGNFAGYRPPRRGGRGESIDPSRPSAEMSAASMSMASMPAWRRKLPLIIVVVAVLIALVVILVIGQSAELPPTPPPPR